jgi:hypothetical protein
MLPEQALHIDPETARLLLKLPVGWIHDWFETAVLFGSRAVRVVVIVVAVVIPILPGIEVVVV